MGRQPFTVRSRDEGTILIIGRCRCVWSNDWVGYCRKTESGCLQPDASSLMPQILYEPLQVTKGESTHFRRYRQVMLLSDDDMQLYGIS